MLGDERRLKQILINLVKNATKFTREGYVKIILGYDYLSEYLTLYVKDTGIGIN